MCQRHCWHFALEASLTEVPRRPFNAWLRICEVRTAEGQIIVVHGVNLPWRVVSPKRHFLFLSFESSWGCASIRYERWFSSQKYCTVGWLCGLGPLLPREASELEDKETGNTLGRELGLYAWRGWDICLDWIGMNLRMCFFKFMLVFVLFIYVLSYFFIYHFIIFLSLFVYLFFLFIHVLFINPICDW